MRAAVSAGRDRIEVARVPIPEPGPGQVRIRVAACGVCGSDLHFHHAGFYAPGHVPGHEYAGVVESLGPDVGGFAAGDAVAIEPLDTCGACSACRAGRDSICSDAQYLGISRPGGLAELAVAPAHRLFRLPRGVEPRLGALAEPLAVAIHGLDRGGFAAGQRVLVLGAGSIGLATLLAARAGGAAEVWISARHAHQAALARDFGATRVLAESEATPAALAAISRSAAIDLAVETVGGSADTLRAAVAALRPGGCVSVLGVFLAAVSADPMPLLVKEVTLAWSNCYARGPGRPDFARALDLIDAERERLARLVTHRVPLDDIARGFALAGDKRAGAIKVSIEP
jgi:threonine dehydrogenase-like Zn-dependent dehydrogenase